MSPALIGILSIVIVIALMFMRVPVAFSMLIVAFFGLIILNSTEGAFSVLGSVIYTQFASYTMSVTPLFALMGMFAANSGVGKKLFDTADSFLGHVSGGLCMAVQVACAIFGAICGSNSATVVTIGGVACPQMKRLGYDDTLATSAVASGACLASLIPPSVVFIVYGTATDVSIGKLFIAGIIPGIVMMLIFILDRKSTRLNSSHT
jgi:C4-dicarboxylate transporter DctM subunit